MKMNKIVAGVSAAALAVSALATSAFAANGEWTVELFDTVLDHYEVTLEQTKVGTEIPAATGAFSADKFLTSPVKFKLNQTVTANIDDLTFNGSVKAEQPYEIKLGTYSDKGTISGTAELKDVYVAGSTDKEISVEVNTLSKLIDASADYAKTAGKYTVVISTSIPADKLADVIGSAEYAQHFDADTGRLKSGSNFERLVSRGLFTTGTSAITVTPEANGDVLSASDVIDTWKVTAFKIADRKDPVSVKTVEKDIKFRDHFNFEALKALIPGGTVTLKFDTSIPENKQYSVNIRFENSTLAISSANSYTTTGDTLTFDLPANFTGTDKQIFGEPIMYVKATGWDMSEKCNLTSVTLKAKNGASVTESTQAPVVTTAPEDNRGENNTNKPSNDKNQPTGAAIAIVPAVAAAAAVVISKKRK